jgi:putative transcriptional regulator
MHPAAGTVLVASPTLRDPNFLGTVVYVLDHGPNGTLGFIVNRPLEVPLDELWEDVPAHLSQARIAALGGPVDRHKGLLLHGCPAITDAQRMADGVFAGGSIPELVARYADGADQTGPRLFLGHSGWASGQLEVELAEGAWFVRPGKISWLLDPVPMNNLWQHLVEGRTGLPDPSVN